MLETPSLFQRIKFYLLLLPLAFGLGMGSGYIIWGRESAAPVQQVTRYDVSVDDDPVVGPKDAPITIIEFSDYQCPYCKKWHDEVFDRLLASYPEQIRFVYRDFPIPGHNEAGPAAEAANCAAEQDAFWQFHDDLFSMAYGLDSAAYQQYAAELGLDMDAFNDCLTSRRYMEEVQADYQYAANLGIRATPTFFINGIPIEGALPYESFKQIIDQELAGEIP